MTVEVEFSDTLSDLMHRIDEIKMAAVQLGERQPFLFSDEAAYQKGAMI
jgi:hypothetical protein